MNKKNKILLWIGIVLIVGLIIFTVVFGIYQKEHRKAEAIQDFNEKKEAIFSESDQIEQDTMKARKFIEDHLPFELNYLVVEQEMKTTASGEQLTLYYVEEALLNGDVQTWLSYFSPSAIEKMMSQLNEVTLEGRSQELLEYMNRMTRGGKLTSLSSYETNNDIYAVLQYSDGVEVELPLEFVSVEDDDMLINTDVLQLIKQIEKASS